MTTALTSGINISIDCSYEDRFSNPENELFMFSYKIEIENKNQFPIQLLRRHWHIIDSTTQSREVDGEGVIGEQPIIMPGDTFAYRSSCDFRTDTGKMCGYYIMENLETHDTFEVEIPEFLLMVPHKLN